MNDRKSGDQQLDLIGKAILTLSVQHAALLAARWSIGSDAPN